MTRSFVRDSSDSVRKFFSLARTSWRACEKFVARRNHALLSFHRVTTKLGPAETLLHAELVLCAFRASKRLHSPAQRITLFLLRDASPLEYRKLRNFSKIKRLRDTPAEAR